MSHYWCYKCVDCDEETEGINHGDAQLLALGTAYPLIQQLREKYQLEIEKIFYHPSYETMGWDFLNFLEQHYDHFVVVETEYLSLKDEYPDRSIKIYGPEYVSRAS